MKLIDIVNKNQILKQIVETKDIPVTFKFKVLGVMKAIEPFLVNLETIRNELINKYGETKEDGTISLARESENFPVFAKEYEELLNGETDYDMPKFKASEIMNIGIDTNLLLGMYDIIEE